jgi:tetratricopeptide (TPR) repeat protein
MTGEVPTQLEEPTPKPGDRRKAQRHDRGWEAAVVAGVAVVAFALRLAYLWQIRSAPYFDDPIADSLIYLERAGQILAGDWVGDGIYFHSSPPYPYFIALVFSLSRGSFLALGVIQALFGTANCVLVYFLARRLGGRAAAAVAGITAALYGLLAFFDGELLMIFLTLFFGDLALLLLLRARKSRRLRWALLAGISLGLAALDKTNLLLFAPVAAWWLAAEYSLRWRAWRWKPALVFAVGVSLMVLPVTLRNYLVADDLVLISSNAGVNLFIGNNPQGRGVFHLPPDSGLTNTDLYGSSVAVAEAESGRKLKPSEVSEFWSGKALHFMRERPFEVAKLVGWKVLLLFNAVEIPNHLDFYYVRWKYAPVLWILFAGFWLVAPLALVGLGRGLLRGPGPVGGLYLGFLASYVASLLPFFISERYRLPMVPVLIAFAAALVVDMVEMLRLKAYRRFAAAAVGLAAAAVFVNWPYANEFNYLPFYQRVIAEKHLRHARAARTDQQHHLAEAIRELKQVLEVSPASTAAHVNLGTAFRMAGFYSGAIREYEAALQLDPNLPDVAAALLETRRGYALQGDRVDPSSLPKSPFEEAEALEAAGRSDEAIRAYETIVERDPFHYNALSNLAGILVRRGELKRAAALLTRGLDRQPDNFGLLYNLAYVRLQLGAVDEARDLWRRCLEIQPGNALVEQQLRALSAAR